jgi:hypothetical protein
VSSMILRHAAADSEFRERLLADPESFGASAAEIPAPVEPQDTESLKFWTEGLARMDVGPCATSCSFGIFTIVCDGSTK